MTKNREKTDWGAEPAAIVGLGALGSELLRTLALGGARELLLIDPDTLEPSNLRHSAFYQPSDLGRAKVEAAGERALELAPGLRVSAMRCEIADAGWGQLQRCRVIFGCVDRDSARLEMARIGTRLDIPVCDGGLGANIGRASWFAGFDAACFGCRLSAARRRELLIEWQSLPHPCGAADESIPATGTLAGLRRTAEATAGLMTALAQVRLAGSVSREWRGGEVSEPISLAKSDACPFHANQAGRLGAIPETFAGALSANEEARWEWPISTRARCLACGFEWRPMVRVARLRRASCPQCGGRPLPLESLDRAGPQPLRPESLGLPPDHRYTIQVKTSK